MRVLIFVRIAILILVNVGACSGIASHTRRNEMVDTKVVLEAAATNDTIPTTEETVDEAHGKDKSLFSGKDDEARGPTVKDFLSRLSVRMVDTNFKRVRAIDTLSSKVRKAKFDGNIYWIMNADKYWQLMEEEANGWLEGGVNPQTAFSYLKLDTVLQKGTDLVTMKYDTKLVFWFHYVKNYRIEGKTRPDYAAFNNKELLEFLATHIREQNDLKLTLSLYDKSPFNPYVPVVSLFDFYRKEGSMEDFAVDMLAYMLTDPITKDLVLEEWLLEKESPANIFKFLDFVENVALKGTDDVTLFTGWLQYVRKYLHSGATDFDIGRFIEKQLPMMLLSRAKVMFESSAIENVLGDVEYQTGNLAAHVRGIWQRFPQILLDFHHLSDEKITDFDSSSFVSVVASMALYTEFKPFDGDLMFDSLNVKHSFDEVVDLFQELARTADSIDILQPSQVPLVKKYAHTMVQYLFDSSLMLRLHGDPKFVLDDLVARNAEVSVIKNWFLASVMYYQRVENKLLNEAIIDLILLLQERLPFRRDPRVSWLTIVAQLQKEDARIDSAFKLLQDRAREQNRSGRLLGSSR